MHTLKNKEISLSLKLRTKRIVLKFSISIEGVSDPVLLCLAVSGLWNGIDSDIASNNFAHSLFYFLHKVFPVQHFCIYFNTFS